MKTYIDLHIHSTASDGTFSPTEIVNKALKLTEKDSPVVIALTDHDTVAKDRLTAISGLEISTDYHGVEIHVLGYNIDIHNKELLDRLAVCRESRDGRNEKIIQKLQEQGFKISMDEIKPDKPGETIARPHIAKLLMKKKYVSSVVERIMPTPEEAIHLIKNSGGIPVLAHLMLYKKLDSSQKEALVRELKEAGLIGIETYYNTYTPVEQEYVAGLAKQWGLIETGGTDFHGQNKPHISLFTGQGEMEVPQKVLENLKY